MTYREKIQTLVETLEGVYNDAEWLRDVATEEEKIYWNKLRQLLYIDYRFPLVELDNNLSNERASMKL